MPDRENVMLGLQLCSRPEGWTVGCLLDCPYDHEEGCRRNLMLDAIALLKAQKPCEDWISRKRLKDEIQYYIDEAGWGEEVNKALGWCLEFIDNQRAVTWNDA